MDAKFHRMFSVPVLQTAPYKFSKEELDIVRNEKNNIMDNVGKNVSTTDTSVFKKLPKMYEFCNYHLQYYIRELIKVIPDIEFYITQSWINFNPKGSFHHTHYHPNSLISGVFAIQNNSNIPFILDRPPPAKIFDNLLTVYDYSELNEFNSAKTTIDLPTGTLILFPSKLFHQVPENKETEDRITLAFNTFLKGKLGGPSSFLGELKL
tara:strand:+ start:1978 stop:2601 length:624 start_codon:yes stop_codon:yes gene_type:complete